MKKILFTLCLGAAVMPASAEVTTFVAQGAPMCRYHGPADAKIVEVPTGFCWRQQSDAKQRGPEFTSKGRFMEKTMASDLVDINELWIKEDPNNVNSAAVTLVPCSHVEAGSFRWYWDRAMQITPAAGVTVTGISMKLNNNGYVPVSVIDVQGANVSRVADFVYNSTDSTMTWTGSYDKPFYIDMMGTNYERKAGTLRPIYFEITTTGTSTQVAMPVCTTKHSMLATNEKVELTCSTPGAQIYYTIDYDLTWNTQTKYKPSTESTLYTGPFSIEKDAVVRAIAVKEGMTPSFISYKEFYPMPEYAFVGEFNFNDYTSLKDEDGKQIADYKTYPLINSAILADNATVEKVSLAKYPAVDKDVTFTGTITNETSGEGCDLTLSNTFGGVVELRPLSGSVMYISVPDDKYISAVYMEATISNAIALNDEMAGNYKTGHINGTQKIWTNESKDVNEVALKVTASGNYVDHVWVFYSNIDGSTGIDTIEADNDAPATYYNLQGVRVANPAKGQIYIKCQGAKATKIIF